MLTHLVTQAYWKKMHVVSFLQNYVTLQGSQHKCLVKAYSVLWDECESGSILGLLLVVLHIAAVRK